MTDTEVMKWLLYEMKVDTTYPINERQRDKILELWDIFHLQIEYYLTFSTNYERIIKRKRNLEVPKIRPTPGANWERTA